MYVSGYSSLRIIRVPYTKGYPHVFAGLLYSLDGYYILGVQCASLFRLTVLRTQNYMLGRYKFGAKILTIFWNFITVYGATNSPNIVTNPMFKLKAFPNSLK